MPKVYVVQEMPNHNIAPALAYGEIEILLPSNMQIAFSVAPAIRRLRNKLRHFGDSDYLLMTGDPVAIGVACAVASHYNGGKFAALKWDRRDHLYIPVRVDTTEKGERDDF